MSTNAPKAVTLVTMPGSFMPGLDVFDLVHALGEVERLELLARSRPGLASSARMSFSVGRPRLPYVLLLVDLLAERLIAHQVP